MIKRQGSRTFFGGFVNKDPQPLPGLPTATQHSRAVSVLDLWLECIKLRLHDHALAEQLYEQAHASSAPHQPPCSVPDESSSLSSSDDEVRKRKKKEERPLCN